MKKSALLLVLLISALSAFSQTEGTATESKPKAHNPNLPGLFLVDLGVNLSIGEPDSWNQGFWGSRTVNIYYQYPIRFGKSKFSFNPGLGLSLERWKFKDNFTLMDKPETGTQIEQYNLVDAKELYPKSANKSMFITNYFEIPIGFRFDTKPEDIARSINFEIGGRVGFLYDAFTKVRYNDKGEVVKIKNKFNHGLETVRYGAYARFGIGSFTFFGFYNLSDMFRKNLGPEGTGMNTMTVGIGINGF